MTEENTERTEQASNDNSYEDNGNPNLVRVLKKASEKQSDNLTTKLTETLSTSLTKMLTSSLF